MEKDIKMIPYTDDDYNFVYEVKKEAYKKYVEECFGSWDEEDQKNRFKDNMNKSQSITSIIVVNDKKVGFYQGKLLDDNTYYIENICVGSEFRGNGIGSIILKNIISEYRDKDIKIQYFKQNPVGNLYKRLGFIPDGETEFHYQMIKPKEQK